MKDLFIYYPRKGIVIPLTEEVYICDPEDMDAPHYGMTLDGVWLHQRHHKGVRIDNYNMTNFLEG